MRKRRFVCGMLALCLALSVAGCGKTSEEKQAANYYQKELGLDKDEAEELAHELYGKDEDEEKPNATQAPEETVIEPLPELVNSEWWECKLQIYDMVFKYRNMTEEDIRKIVAGSAYNTELMETFDKNGNVEIDSLWVDGDMVVDFRKNLRYDISEQYIIENYGLSSDVDYYLIGFNGYATDAYRYEKKPMEFGNLKTRSDVLAYLAENGFVEVEKEQLTYAYRPNVFDGVEVFSTLYRPVEYADVPHYYCKGAQSITIYWIHKLDETDQVIEREGHHYSGAHANLVCYVTFTFNTDGTIEYKDMSYSDYYKQADADEAFPGWYLPDLYRVDDTIRAFEILGEQID